DVDLFSFLPTDANPNGTFEGYDDGMFSPGMEGAGSFDITYNLTNDSPCTEGEASATFTITVLESAYAGQGMDPSVCMDAGVQNLFDFLSMDADTTGEFTLDGDVITDGMMNPADFEAGEYEVTYTVDEINDCGGDTAIFNITVQESPDAPTVEDDFEFCAINTPTGADLSATGDNLTFYSDETLMTMVMPEDLLASGTYYVTQRIEEDGCESEATMFTVNVSDADTPTISETNPTFCEFDDATLADLTDMIGESGTITWYDTEDGDNALNNGTSLQDGVAYYATLFNAETGCESSVRLKVTVTIDDDCPLTIPEGFSPNGDGLNDTFDIRNIRDKYPNYTIEIRNRFGDVVYKGNTNTPDWDGYSTEGSFGSDILPVGAYFYYLDYNDGSTEPVRGTVYLSR
ncbi:MAG: gliding motility-associated C-terminal domain-containing protein, partial [Christiangramia sp.]